jgi:radical SAM superfamily enzyme YgiQ (UPF0313 family)
LPIIAGRNSEKDMRNRAAEKRKFYIEVIKPSHYDDDGYVIQWVRALIPSNSLAVLYSSCQETANRHVLGNDVEIIVNGYDECHTAIPTSKIIQRIQRGGGVVLLTGVQSNQFPRAADLAREFRQAGVAVVIGGFHVSGCVAMLPELTPELKEMQDLGVSLFAGEAEGRMDDLIQDAEQDQLQPLYNFLLDLPDLRGQPVPILPPHIARRTFKFSSFDAGRGCPFQCSFCTIINVQGRKSRFRDADDIEHLVRANAAEGVCRFFITDDDFARNKNWNAILDRLIYLREKEGFKLKLLIQVDTVCHKIPGFIEKAARAGVNRVFIGLESVNPENLLAANKRQNQLTEYRKMLQMWRAHGVLTHAGYILGFPADTPESIERDIHFMQQELPIDILEFFVMTALPGSADHKALYEKGVWLEPDLNRYDSEHITVRHPKMSDEELLGVYDRAWHLYYTPQHVETLLRRAQVDGCGVSKMQSAVLAYYGIYRFENLHPLQGGILRRKQRSSRRSTFPRENPLLFYPRRLWETAATYLSIGRYYLQLERIKRRVARDPDAEHYTDLSLARSEPIAEERHTKQRVELPIAEEQKRAA